MHIEPVCFKKISNGLCKINFSLNRLRYIYLHREKVLRNLKKVYCIQHPLRIPALPKNSEQMIHLMFTSHVFLTLNTSLPFFLKNKFHPPVSGSSIFSVIIRNRNSFSIACVGYSVLRDSFISEIYHNRFRSPD